MPKVHLLNPELIAKIAAGEIIERPASVVKELVENSLDAGATRLEVHLKDAGKTLIHIKDNGHGIERDDLDNIFLRHATSKISSEDDLANIMSLGFRGEALYSVAAISDVLLMSRTSGDDSGWEIHLRGGEKLNLRPCTFNKTGTEIEIKELFFNTPARKKFLKSNTTEIYQILNTFIPYTLLYHDRAFLLSHQGKDLLDLGPAQSLKSRAAEVLNLEEKYILETKRDLPQKNFSIHLLLGDINIARTRRDMQFIFINNRPVQNKALAFHLNQVFRLIMPEDVYPFFAAYISLNPADVDVNIHPSKREVKIKEEQWLGQVIRSLCEETLMTSSGGKQVDDGMRVKKLHNFVEQGLSKSQMPVEELNSLFTDTSKEATSKYLNQSFPQSSWINQGSSVSDQKFYIPQESLFTLKQENLQTKLSGARYIGSFINKYLIFELEKSLLIVDQHAAQERIAYEELLKQMNNGNLEIQHLLTPILIALNVSEMLLWEDARERLEDIGLSTAQFDKETVAIHTYPQLVREPERAFRDILAGEDVARCDHDTLARWACRSSIMAGDSMTKEQADYQRKQLIKCLDPLTCPHGRPTVIEIQEQFLDKQFLRK